LHGKLNGSKIEDRVADRSGRVTALYAMERERRTEQARPECNTTRQYDIAPVPRRVGPIAFKLPIPCNPDERGIAFAAGICTPAARMSTTQKCRHFRTRSLAWIMREGWRA
jgi:hypothetical protein